MLVRLEGGRMSCMDQWPMFQITLFRPRMYCCVPVRKDLYHELSWSSRWCVKVIKSISLLIVWVLKQALDYLKRTNIYYLVEGRLCIWCHWLRWSDTRTVRKQTPMLPDDVHDRWVTRDQYCTLFTTNTHIIEHCASQFSAFCPHYVAIHTQDFIGECFRMQLIQWQCKVASGKCPLVFPSLV